MIASDAKTRRRPSTLSMGPRNPNMRTTHNHPLVKLTGIIQDFQLILTTLERNFSEFPEETTRHITSVYFLRDICSASNSSS